MVQMGDALAVERAVANLNNTTFFGCKMQLGCVTTECLFVFVFLPNTFIFGLLFFIIFHVVCYFVLLCLKSAFLFSKLSVLFIL